LFLFFNCDASSRIKKFFEPYGFIPGYLQLKHNDFPLEHIVFNCKYPGMNPYGSKNFLILELASQLKNKNKVKNNHNSK
jgi:hypothetical protein